MCLTSVTPSIHVYGINPVLYVNTRVLYTCYSYQIKAYSSVCSFAGNGWFKDFVKWTFFRMFAFGATSTWPSLIGHCHIRWPLLKAYCSCGRRVTNTYILLSKPVTKVLKRQCACQKSVVSQLSFTVSGNNLITFWGWCKWDNSCVNFIPLLRSIYV